MIRFITALLLAAAFTIWVVFAHGLGCPPGYSFYFERHDILKDGRAVRLYPVYVCRLVPADR